MKNVLFVASECVPFIKTGGLADVVGSLPKCFNKDEFDVRVIIPKYMCMKEEYKNQLEYITHFYMDLSWRSQYVGVLETIYDGIHFYFIDNEFYFAGFQPYGNIHEDIEKFAFLPRTGGTDHRYKIPLTDGKAGVSQGEGAVLKFFTDMLDFQQHK